MREVLLVVPDLSTPVAASCGALAAPAAARLRFGRARPLRAGWRSAVADWLGRPDLDALAPAEVVAAAVVDDAAAGPSPALSGAWLATPLHLVAGLDTVHLPRDGIAALEPAERESLATDFGAALGAGRLALRPVGPEAFLLLGLDLEAVRTVDPLECLESDLASLQPTGPGARVLRRLTSEIEMWLHEHPVNQQRAARGARPVRALWPWGGMPSSRPAPGVLAEAPGEARAGGPGTSPGGGVPRYVYSADAWTRAAARLAGRELAPEGALPDARALRGAGDALVTARFHGECVPDAAAFEARYLQPALEALRGGHLGRLTVVTADRAVAVESADRYRVWRPRRDWLTALGG